MFDTVEVNFLFLVGLIGVAFGMGMLFEGINSFKKFAKDIADRANS